jgi:hypothetical protein
VDASDGCEFIIQNHLKFQSTLEDCALDAMLKPGKVEKCVAPRDNEGVIHRDEGHWQYGQTDQHDNRAGRYREQRMPAVAEPGMEHRGCCRRHRTTFPIDQVERQLDWRRCRSTASEAGR